MEAERLFSLVRLNIEQGKKAFALSADRVFKADHKDFIVSKAKGAELSVRLFL